MAKETYNFTESVVKPLGSEAGKIGYAFEKSLTMDILSDKLPDHLATVENFLSSANGKIWSDAMVGTTFSEVKTRYNASAGMIRTGEDILHFIAETKKIVLAVIALKSEWLKVEVGGGTDIPAPIFGVKPTESAK